MIKKQKKNTARYHPGLKRNTNKFPGFLKTVTVAPTYPWKIICHNSLKMCVSSLRELLIL